MARESLLCRAMSDEGGVGYAPTERERERWEDETGGGVEELREKEMRTEEREREKMDLIMVRQ